MKTTIKMFALLLVVGCAQFATAKGIDKTETPKRPDMHILNNVIEVYVNGISKGQVEGIENIFDDAAQFSALNNGKVTRHSKSSEMVQLLNNKGVVQQDCKVSYSVVETKSNYAMVKVVLNYTDFSRENFVTMFDDGDGWKIGSVTSVFVSKAK